MLPVNIIYGDLSSKSKKMDGSHIRLKNARLKAGFRTAGEAADRFGWNDSTYRGHENAQNGYKRMAPTYAKAFGVSAAYLMFGEGNADPTEPSRERHPPAPVLDPVRTAHVIAAILRRVRTDMSAQDADLWAQVVIERALQAPDPVSEPLDSIQTSLLAQFGARKLFQP